jgi:hypothetical protein
MATKIRFKTECVEVLVVQDGYRRLFERAKQPFALSAEPQLAQHELRAFAQHEHLELYEADEDAPAKSDVKKDEGVPASVSTKKNN